MEKESSWLGDKHKSPEALKSLVMEAGEVENTAVSLI